jgi:hypothetical protein
MLLVSYVMESTMYLLNVSLPHGAMYESTSQGWVVSIAGKDL